MTMLFECPKLTVETWMVWCCAAFLILSLGVLGAATWLGYQVESMHELLMPAALFLAAG